MRDVFRDLTDDQLVRHFRLIEEEMAQRNANKQREDSE